MLIYDFKNQEVVDFYTIFLTLSILAIGLVFLFVFSKYKPHIKHDFSTRLLGLSRQDLVKQAKLTPAINRMIGIILIVVSLLSIFDIIKDTIYLREIDYFEDIESVSGRIVNLNTRNIIGAEQITIDISNKSFHIIKDQRYNSKRDLLVGDSIKIEYFVYNKNSKNGDSQHFEVVRIDLK